MYDRMRMFLIAIFAGGLVFWLITQVNVNLAHRHPQPAPAVHNPQG